MAQKYYEPLNGHYRTQTRASVEGEKARTVYLSNKAKTLGVALPMGSLPVCQQRFHF